MERMNPLKLALLPLYIQLYDDHWPGLRERADAFHRTIVGEFERRGLEVVTSPVCRIKPEFEQAVRLFEERQADAIVTLHLAYSPSLESAGALAATALPLIVLDTTPTYDYGPSQHPDELLYNHGIHGVQDLCNVLIRRGKHVLIEAGHWAESDVLDRVVDGVKAAHIAKCLRHAKVGMVGKPFAGMGDFALPADTLRSTIGIETVFVDLQHDRDAFVAAVDDRDIDAEMARDERQFRWRNVDRAVYRQSIRDCLVLRGWIEATGLTAFTINFMEVTGETPLSSMPFLEASKAMARGIGYAGEGDVLTAALAGALLSVYPDASFTEMFCPDWKHNSIFLSHMGEMNVRAAAGRPLLREKEFPFTSANNPVVAYGTFRAGEAVYVCLAPGKADTYTLILSPVRMLDIEGEDRMEESVHGWFRPAMPVSDFLAAFSRHGGIHHGVIVYGDATHVIRQFGEMMGWRTVIIA